MSDNNANTGDPQSSTPTEQDSEHYDTSRNAGQGVGSDTEPNTGAVSDRQERARIAAYWFFGLAVVSAFLMNSFLNLFTVLFVLVGLYSISRGRGGWVTPAVIGLIIMMLVAWAAWRVNATMKALDEIGTSSSGKL